MTVDLCCVPVVRIKWQDAFKWDTHFFQTPFSPSSSGLCVSLFLRLSEELCPMVATVGRLEGRRKGEIGYYLLPVFVSGGLSSMALSSSVCSPLTPWFQLSSAQLCPSAGFSIVLVPAL